MKFIKEGKPFKVGESLQVFGSGSGGFSLLGRINKAAKSSLGIIGDGKLISEITKSLLK